MHRNMQDYVHVHVMYMYMHTFVRYHNTDTQLYEQCMQASGTVTLCPALLQDMFT